MLRRDKRQNTCTRGVIGDKRVRKTGFFDDSTGLS